MAYFALIDENNIVVNVVAVSDEHEHRGQEYLSEDLGWKGRWLQTSYNSRGGVHYDPETMSPSGKQAFRKNYAGIGFKYDETLDAFIPPKPFEFPSFVINPKTALWEPPISEPSPQEGGAWVWIESEVKWIFIENQEDPEMI